MFLTKITGKYFVIEGYVLACLRKNEYNMIYCPIYPSHPPCWTVTIHTNMEEPAGEVALNAPGGTQHGKIRTVFII
jgi:hypothetical protein